MCWDRRRDAVGIGEVLPVEYELQVQTPIGEKGIRPLCQFFNSQLDAQPELIHVLKALFCVIEGVLSGP